MIFGDERYSYAKNFHCARGIGGGFSFHARARARAAVLTSRALVREGALARGSLCFAVVRIFA